MTRSYTYHDFNTFIKTTIRCLGSFINKQTNQDIIAWRAVIQLSIFVGALTYANYLVLLSPNTNTMLLQIFDDYAAQFKVVYNASKSKCLCCHPTGTSKQVTQAARFPPFSIWSHMIEFEDRCPIWLIS